MYSQMFEGGCLVSNSNPMTVKQQTICNPLCKQHDNVIHSNGIYTRKHEDNDGRHQRH